jgi:hypothetical protein
MVNIDSIHIDKSPVIILASPRTGCSVIGELLSLKYQMRYFNEPFASHVFGKDDSTQFLNQTANNPNYILKTMAYDFYTYAPDQLKEKAKSAFIIRTRRKDILEQITSHYIATKRGIFMYNKHTIKADGLQEMYEKEVIPIDRQVVLDIIKHVKRYNDAVDNLPVTVDVDLWYEDIDGIESPNLLKSIQPANYNKIKQEIGKIYDAPYLNYGTARIWQNNPS